MPTKSHLNWPNTRCRESRPRDTIGWLWRAIVWRRRIVAWFWSSIACWRLWGPVRWSWGSVGWFWRTVRGFRTVSVSLSTIFKPIQEWNGRFCWSWSAKDVEDSVKPRFRVFWKTINRQGLDWIPNRNNLDADFLFRRSIIINSPGLVEHIEDWMQESTENKTGYFGKRNITVCATLLFLLFFFYCCCHGALCFSSSSQTYLFLYPLAKYVWFLLLIDFLLVCLFLCIFVCFSFFGFSCMGVCILSFLLFVSFLLAW